MPLKVMIVDDSPFTRKLLRVILTSGGFDVVAEAANGSQAVNKYKELRPDLVTIDVVMPDMDGVDVARCIIDYDPQARIIICSGMVQGAVEKRAMKVGVKDFILKPFQSSRVLKVSKRVMAK